MPVELFRHFTFLDPTTCSPADWYKVTRAAKNSLKEVRGRKLTLSDQLISDSGDKLNTLKNVLQVWR